MAAALVVALANGAACTDDQHGAAPVTTAAVPAALPRPVAVAEDPEGITLADPAFEPLPGASADFGRLHGAVYQIEMPDDWNGRLVLYLHGFESLAPEARATAPDFRPYLIAQGYAWGASSFSSTSLIPGRAADETAALWDYFARTYGRPSSTYVTGLSMGGMATHIAAERYADRFDGALSLCGAAGQTPAVAIDTDFFVAGAFVAGVTQAEYDGAADVGTLIRERIRPALEDPVARAEFEDILLDVTGGPRAFDREGFRIEEETNWQRTELAVGSGIAPNRTAPYALGPLSAVASDDFNAAALRLRTNPELQAGFFAGNETTGRIEMPLLTMHTTGDGQVPIEQARILRREVDAEGRDDMLVQRVVRDAGHCGFTTPEQEDGFGALVAWVERGVRPAGADVLTEDLTTLNGPFDLSPRPGTPAADRVPGAAARVKLHGRLLVDGAPFDATYLGAIVVRDGLRTPCQYTLVPVVDGTYEITVLGDAEASGCGAVGGQILLWTFTGGTTLHTLAALPWPGDGASAEFDSEFSSASPGGGWPPTSDFAGEVVDLDGRHLPGGTRIEAYVDTTRCGVASVRRTGSFAGFSLSVVGPEVIGACATGAPLRLVVDGQPSPTVAVNEPGHQDLLIVIAPDGA
jgi:pimeloyl-ACP methyl ester carboxylesterase